MSVRPIIFSAPMVAALIDGRKSQTRRIIKKQAALDALATFGPDFLCLPGNRDLLPVNVVPSDLLWVREAHALQSDWNRHDGFVHYAADDHTWHTGPNTGDIPDDSLAAWFRVVDRSRDQNCAVIRRSPIHLPRWASRLTLRVTDVRVQRLGEISEWDVYAEGAMSRPAGPRLGSEVTALQNARNAFAALWNSSHGPDAWDANPWVCALTFDVIRANVDAITQPAGDET